MSPAHEDILFKVKALLESAGGFTAGSIRMLNLDALEREAGDRWPVVKGRLTEAARETMKQYLGPKDTYLPLANGMFIVIFGEYSGDAARMRVASIAREIRKRVLADKDIPRFDLKLFNETTAVSADASANGMATFASFVSEHRRLELQNKNEDPFVACANAEIHYSPLWDTLAEVSFKAVLEVATESLPVSLRRRRGSAEHASDRRAQAVVDCSVLAGAVEALRGCSPGGACSILAPVICATSFSTDSLVNLILPYLRSVPEDMRDHFMPLLLETRLGSSAADLRGKPALLRQFSRQVGLITNLEDTGHAAAKAEGFALIAVDARHYGGVSATRFGTAVRRFAELAARNSLRSAVIGADRPELARAAIDAPVDLIGGEAISDSRTTPPQPLRIHARDLMDRLTTREKVA